MAFALLVAPSAHAGWGAAAYTVNVTTDSAPTTGGAGSGTTGDLRYAITQAEASGSPGNSIQIIVPGTITLAASLPAINQYISSISGPGANQLTISGANSYQVFNVSGGTVAISGLTIANAADSTGGGGIVVSSGATLNVSNCVFAGNKTTSSNYGGGAILNLGTLTVTGSTFYGNSAPSQGGGAIGSVPSTTTTVTNSTFYGNSASAQGAAILANATLTVTGSTFVDNSTSTGGGGAMSNGGAGGVTWTLTNNIFADNSAPTDGGINDGGATVTESYNLFFDNSGGDGITTYGTGDVHGSDPKLLPLGNYGGTTPTMLPRPESPAIDAGTSTGAPTQDQRGFALGSTVDIGAVQTNYTAATTLASSYSGLEDVDLTGLSGTQTVSGGITISSGAVNLIGPGAGTLSVSGGGSGSVFTVDSGASAAFYGMTITDGSASTGGGGIHNEGTVSVLDSAISGNSVPITGGTSGGGGIFNSGTTTVLDSTISGNSVSGTGNVPITAYGGGIDNNGAATLTVLDSTISGNNLSCSSPVCNSKGGGIANFGTATLTNVTVSGNNAPQRSGGGIYANGTTTTLTLNNSIVEGNSAGAYPDIYLNNSPTYTNNSSVVNTTNTATTVDLAALGYYGGTTQTMPPLTGSPALNAGTYQTGEPTTDQRGAPRPSTSGAAIDSGAVQITGEPPIIFSVTPNNGSINGGTSVTITGTGLDAATAVKFGSNAATGVTVNAGSGTSLSTVTASSPAGSSDGTVDITVANNSGTSATSSSSQFTYWTPVSISPVSIPIATYGAPVNETFTVAGGSGSYTLSSTGTPPAGLTLTSSGTVWTLSGTATATGSATLSLTATDKTYSSNTTTQSYMLTVARGTPVATVTQPTLTYGQSGTITVTLAPQSPGAGISNPSGTVTYAIDGGSPQTATLNNGVASFSVPSTLAQGSHGIVWSYGGDSNYNSLANQTITQSVGATPLTISVNSFSRAYGAANPTLTGTVTGLQNGDTASSVGLTYSTTASTSSPVGTYSITAAITSTNYSVNVTQGTLTVTQAATATALSASVSSITPGQSLTLTATVTDASTGSTGTPTGTVSFYDGSTLLGTSTLSGGTATYTTSTLAAGATHSLTATYAGSADFAASASSTAVSIPVAALDFSLNITGSQNQTVVPGASASYSFEVTPTYGIYPGAVSFSVSGLPSGATATFTPSTIAANGGAQQVTMTIQTAAPGTSAKNSNPFERGGATLALSFLLVPLFGIRKRKGMMRMLCIAVLLLGGGACTALISGCGAMNGFNGQAVENYTVTVTATSGGTQHSFGVNLNVQ